MTHCAGLFGVAVCQARYSGPVRRNLTPKPGTMFYVFFARILHAFALSLRGIHDVCEERAILLALKAVRSRGVWAAKQGHQSTRNKEDAAR